MCVAMMALCAGLALPAASVSAQTHQHYKDVEEASRPAPGGELAPRLLNLGAHTFPAPTCSDRAREFIAQGVNLTYGFNHAEAGRSFREAARLDPTCAMAYWGQALVLGPNINAGMEPDDEPRAHGLIQQAVGFKANASPREQAYIEALAQRYSGKAADRAARDRAYAAAMRDVSRRFPDDLDAAAFYAESVMDLADADRSLAEVARIVNDKALDTPMFSPNTMADVLRIAPESLAGEIAAAGRTTTRRSRISSGSASRAGASRRCEGGGWAVQDGVGARGLHAEWVAAAVGHRFLFRPPPHVTGVLPPSAYKLHVHRLARRQPQPAADDPIEHPGADRHGGQPERDEPDDDEHQRDRECGGNRNPEQGKPERPDLPAEVGFQECSAHPVPPDVVHHDGDDRGQAEQERRHDHRRGEDPEQHAEPVQGIDDVCPGDVGRVGRDKGLRERSFHGSSSSPAMYYGSCGSGVATAVPAAENVTSTRAPS